MVDLPHAAPPQLLWKLAAGYRAVTLTSVDGDYRIALTWVGGAWAYHQHHPGGDRPVQHLHDAIRNATVSYQRRGW